MPFQNFDFRGGYTPQEPVIPKTGLMRTLTTIAVTAVFGLVAFYLSLPALNFQSQDFYGFILLLCAVYCVTAFITSGVPMSRGYFRLLKKQCAVPVFIAAAVGVIFVAGSVSSMTIFHAPAYRSLINVQEGNFTEDIKEVSFSEIPMLDKASAQMLGDRRMGQLSDMVSQYEVSSEYTQINYKAKPVRVTPLVYGDFFKWFNNRKTGLPAYIMIDMVTQNVEVVRLSEGMKYSTSELFGRNLTRHLRFNYPTLMFDKPTLEIDDSGHPFWVCSRLVKRIGLFGGSDIKGAVLVDAVTGQSQYYEVVPNWVDTVYTAQIVLQQYDFYGTLKNGFWNSIFGQRGVTVTTEGYNYLARNDDVYVYTGITSVGGDQSNIGFIMVNLRTKDTKFYSIPGAEEYSAMNSAQGVVQHLNYKATFPLLINISAQPTYFMALKDNANLVKQYAMVNVGQYQLVATGVTVQECQKNYLSLLGQSGLLPNVVRQETAAMGKITEIRSAVKDGNTFFYLKLDSGSEYYMISAAADPGVVILNVGDSVKIDYATMETGPIKTAYTVTKQ